MEKNRQRKIKLIVGAFLTFLILPLLMIILWSFANSWPWPSLLPESFGLRGWKYFFTPASNSVHTLLFSVLLSFVVAVVTLVVTIPAARALAFYTFKGKKLIEIVAFAPVIVPLVAVAMGIHLQFIRIGLANTYLGVVLIHMIPCIPYTIWILRAVLEMIGRKMEEQARVLGANPVQIFCHVTFPMLLPGIISAGSMAFIVSFSQYFLTLLIGGGKIMTFSMLMFPYIQSGDRMMGSVYSVVFIVTTLLFLWLIEKGTNKYYGDKLKEYRYV